MKKVAALLSVILLGGVLSLHAEDVPAQAGVRRLEFVHYDPVAHVVEWGVSKGTVNPAGQYVPDESPNSNFSINLGNGVMTDDRGDNALDSTEAAGAVQAFRALSILLQGYTEHFENPTGSVQEDSNGDDDLDDVPVQNLRAIATPPVMDGGVPGSGKIEARTVVSFAAGATKSANAAISLNESQACTASDSANLKKAGIFWSQTTNQFFPIPSKSLVAQRRPDQVERRQLLPAAVVYRP